MLIPFAFQYDLWRANCMQQYLGFLAFLLFSFSTFFFFFTNLLWLLDSFGWDYGGGGGGVWNDRHELWDVSNVRIWEINDCLWAFPSVFDFEIALKGFMHLLLLCRWRHEMRCWNIYWHDIILQLHSSARDNEVELKFSSYFAEDIVQRNKYENVWGTLAVLL